MKRKLTTIFILGSFALNSSSVLANIEGEERAEAIGDFCFKWCKKDINIQFVVYCKRPYCALYPHRLARNSNAIHTEIPLLHGDQKLRKRLMIKYINDFYGKFMW